MSLCPHLFRKGECRECAPSESTYTDEVIEVMRATIDQLRKDVAELRALNEQLRKDAERFRAVIDGSPLPEGM